ncbi:DNA adenine methylase [Paenibacillus sp. ACRRX]|uniref:DNA adenine methylase n=1 Tax=Paenibacillus sp. ACRRX TaxID=2918206 RepID=UPI001EF4007B|nr:DNA adenine methylase [Paenibacillus sp. ACRRX]MCG7408510.1 DNA adenine methylase [Paenibacillus sp. ACRRX]
MLKPIVKWAGGKRQLLPHLRARLPLLDWSIASYYEPFVGGGALLFAVHPVRAVINDINEDLINVYRVVQQHPEELIHILSTHQNTEDYYYEVRSWDRDRVNYSNLTPIQRAARTLYMNRTCFNGLYRVNSKGFFNVPFGKYSSIDFVQERKIRTLSHYFQSNEILMRQGDYTAAVRHARAGDFVYFDPPYDVLSTTSSFTTYTIGGFGREEQRRLAELFRELDKRGVYVMLSNHATDFIMELFEEYHIHHVEARRLINSVPSARGKIPELIIMNYEPPQLAENLISLLQEEAPTNLA